MTQAYLPELEPHFVRHSDTSSAAAESIKPSAGTLRAKVLDCIVRSSGVTDEEIATRLVMNPSTARPRRLELVEMGLVKDSGERRKTRAGRASVVWVAK